jgi:hypothetical protein
MGTKREPGTASQPRGLISHQHVGGDVHLTVNHGVHAAPKTLKTPKTPNVINPRSEAASADPISPICAIYPPGPGHIARISVVVAPGLTYFAQRQSVLCDGCG